MAVSEAIAVNLRDTIAKELFKARDTLTCEELYARSVTPDMQLSMEDFRTFVENHCQDQVASAEVVGNENMEPRFALKGSMVRKMKKKTKKRDERTVRGSRSEGDRTSPDIIKPKNTLSREQFRLILSRMSYSPRSGERKSTLNWTDIKTHYKKATGRPLNNEELNAISGTDNMTKNDILRGPLSNILVMVDKQGHQVRLLPEKNERKILEEFFRNNRGGRQGASSVSPTATAEDFIEESSQEDTPNENNSPSRVVSPSDSFLTAPSSETFFTADTSPITSSEGELSFTHTTDSDRTADDTLQRGDAIVEQVSEVDEPMEVDHEQGDVKEEDEKKFEDQPTHTEEENSFASVMADAERAIAVAHKIVEDVKEQPLPVTLEGEKNDEEEASQDEEKGTHPVPTPRAIDVPIIESAADPVLSQEETKIDREESLPVMSHMGESEEEEKSAIEDVTQEMELPSDPAPSVDEHLSDVNLLHVEDPIEKLQTSTETLTEERANSAPVTEIEAPPSFSDEPTTVIEATPAVYDIGKKEPLIEPVDVPIEENPVSTSSSAENTTATTVMPQTILPGTVVDEEMRKGWEAPPSRDTVIDTQPAPTEAPAISFPDADSKVENGRVSPLSLRAASRRRVFPCCSLL